jgi:hypothetical protein
MVVLLGVGAVHSVADTRKTFAHPFLFHASKKNLALSPSCVENPDRCFQETLGRRDPFPIQRAEPAEVIGQVARGHTVKARQPAAKTLVVGIHVLYMDRTAYTLTQAHIDECMRNPRLPGE